jgi:hypothetical protein
MILPGMQIKTYPPFTNINEIFPNSKEVKFVDVLMLVDNERPGRNTGGNGKNEKKKKEKKFVKKTFIKITPDFSRPIGGRVDIHA